MGQIKKHFLVIIFLLFYFSITSYKFIAYQTPFYDWDEAIYAQVGKEMVASKSLISLWQGKAWLDKPPLSNLAYGIVGTAASPIAPPEISTRIFTLLMSVVILAFTYVLYYRLTKNQIIALLTVIITSFLPVFLQRAQVLNVDVFLLLGWLGYLVFYPNFWLGLLFLAIGVLSKSLLGFYPPLIFICFYAYQLIFKKINFKEFRKRLTPIIVQMVALMFWYIYMILAYGNNFIYAHFLESHLKRVTASIESHFGKRTFYLDLLFNQLDLLGYVFIGSIFLLLWDYYKKRDDKKILYSFFFIPWFLFLNLTKTKITWYIYHTLPQFAFLSVYPLKYLKNKKIVYYGLALIVASFATYKNFTNNLFFKSQYSSYDQNYQLAVFAKNNCQKLSVLIDPDSRQTHDTLQSMNLLISTSEWWGNHPSYVYYFGKDLEFNYNKESLKNNLTSFKTGECLMIDKKDSDLNPEALKFELLKTFDSLYLYKK